MISINKYIDEAYVPERVPLQQPQQAELQAKKEDLRTPFQKAGDAFKGVGKGALTAGGAVLTAGTPWFNYLMATKQIGNTGARNFLLAKMAHQFGSTAMS